MKELRRIQYNSPVILSFVFISFVALLCNYLTAGIANQWFFSVYRSSLFNPLSYVRVFTHVLGHANWDHFMGNMLLILVVGPILEEKYGSRKLLLMMLVTALITGIINCIFFPHIRLLGASGIVFMLILLSSLTGMKEQRIPLTLVLVALIYIGGEVIQGITAQDNISHLTHIVGGLCGCAFGWKLKPKY